MRIAVSGAAGFIGTYLCRSLRKAFPEARIEGMDLIEPKKPVAGVRYGQKLLGADILFHLAGSAGISPSLKDPLADMELNIGMTIKVLEMVRRGFFDRIVLASSCSVYGSVEGVAKEDQPLCPLTPYGVSKLSAEQYLLAYHRFFNVDGVIARIGNPYGPGQRKLVVYDLILRALKEGGPIRIRGDGKEIRDFIHVEDVSSALILIGFRGEAGEIYNVGSGHPTTLYEVASSIAAALDPSAENIETDNLLESGKVRVFHPSVEKIGALGFLPKWTLTDGLIDTVRWVKEQI